MNLEAFFNSPVSRKESLKRLARVGLGAAGLALLPSIASAEEGPTKVIVGSDGKEWVVSNIHPNPWTDINWYPINPERGLPTLYGPNGPLEKFDQFAREVYGLPTHAAEAERDLSYELMKQPSEYRDSFGHCDALASASIFESEPQAGIVEGFTYSQSIRKGVLTAFHSMSGGIRLDPSDNENNINLIMQRFTQTGQPFVVEDPEDRGGMWYRAAYAVAKDGSALAVTNIGEPDIDVPRTNIRWADIRFHPKLHTVEPKYQIYVAEVAGYEIPDIHNNYKIVQHMVTGKAA